MVESSSWRKTPERVRHLEACLPVSPIADTLQLTAYRPKTNVGWTPASCSGAAKPRSNSNVDDDDKTFYIFLPLAVRKSYEISNVNLVTFQHNTRDNTEADTLHSSQARPSHVLPLCLLQVDCPSRLSPRDEVKDMTFHIIGSLLQIHILGSLNDVSRIASAL